MAKITRIPSHVSRPYVWVLLYQDVFKHTGCEGPETFAGIFSTFKKCDERGTELVELGKYYSNRKYRCRKTYIDELY